MRASRERKRAVRTHRRRQRQQQQRSISPSPCAHQRARERETVKEWSAGEPFGWRVQVGQLARDACCMWLALDVAATAACNILWQSASSAQISTAQIHLGEQHAATVQRSHVAGYIVCCVLHVALTHAHTHTHTTDNDYGPAAIFQLTKGRLVSGVSDDAPAGLIRVEGFDSIRNCNRHAANCSRQHTRATAAAARQSIGKPGRQTFALWRQELFFLFIALALGCGKEEFAKRTTQWTPKDERWHVARKR